MHTVADNSHIDLSGGEIFSITSPRLEGSPVVINLLPALLIEGMYLFWTLRNVRASFWSKNNRLSKAY
ncbi:hypothetical protein BYT27DRAFT_7201140 [Phlegmacium glaucopus]|nr:hypothetical protein BYT27DRAFT_7201140 [Phlegmacium glaucopus]